MESGYFLQAPDKRSQYLYFRGGYNSIDKGVTEWGSNQESDSLLAGDNAGEIVITYEDNSSDSIPLIFGYTMWWHDNWNHSSAPFKGEGEDPESTKILRRTLYLYGAYEGEDTCLLCVKTRFDTVQSIEIKNNPLKMGIPVFTGVGAVATENEKAFFKSHTVDAADPLPGTVQSDLTALFRIMYHTEDELSELVPANAPVDFQTPDIVFYGNHTADILTNILRDNCWDMIRKIDEDGAMNASSPVAFNWGSYVGFGSWRPGQGNYYGWVYSRDTGRAGISLTDAGYAEYEKKVLDYCNEKLMYYPREYPKLTFDGKQVPGHWSVVINKPLVYSTYLVGLGWSTRYTKERFGEEYQNLGNLETDGHGLTMLATYKYFLATGQNVDYVRENWEYIREAAEFIVWSIDNPHLSFAEDGVLYGETEAAMNDYTLYSNIPCCFGMLFYSQMAEVAGKRDYAVRWKEYYQRMFISITDRFAADDGNGWDIEHFGFYHDPVMTMLADFYGYDIENFPFSEWVLRSRNSFQADLSQYVKDTYIAPRGLGYDFGIITQSALLLDRTEDYTKFLIKLAYACYAPKLPMPYLVPEGMTGLPGRGVYRREGDLGNLAQQAEIVKTLLMVCGVIQLPNGTVQITPRLPGRCNVKAKNIHIINNYSLMLDLCVEYHDKVEAVSFELHGNLETPVAFRAGPFTSSNIKVECESRVKLTAARRSGDAWWLDILFEETPLNESISIVFKEIQNTGNEDN